MKTIRLSNLKTTGHEENAALAVVMTEFIEATETAGRGRPKTKTPSNFANVATLYLKGEITRDDAIHLTGLSGSIFFRLVNEHRDEISKEHNGEVVAENGKTVWKRKLGMGKKMPPDNFVSVVELFEEGKISRKQALEQTGLASTTFFEMVREYKDDIGHTPNTSDSPDAKNLYKKQRQAAGIANAKAGGTRFGPDKIPLPENFNDLVALYEQGIISRKEAQSQTGFTEGTFWRRLREHRQKQRVQEADLC